MQYQWVHETQSQQQTWLFKRNCALTPRQLAIWFSALSLTSLTIAIGFVAYGAWFVLVFACIEVSALAIAFFVYAKYAADYDRIVVSPHTVCVESVVGGKVAQLKLDTSWLRVEYSGARRSQVELVCGKQRVAISRFVPEHRLIELSRMLKASLASVRL
jgi:uncharacterized membrane protein